MSVIVFCGKTIIVFIKSIMMVSVDIVRMLWFQLEYNVEEHGSLGGSIIIRLDNGAFVGLIYELLVFS